MNVKELIEKLQELPPELVVFYNDSEIGYGPVDVVYINYYDETGRQNEDITRAKGVSIT